MADPTQQPSLGYRQFLATKHRKVYNESVVDLIATRLNWKRKLADTCPMTRASSVSSENLLVLVLSLGHRTRDGIWHDREALLDQKNMRNKYALRRRVNYLVYHSPICFPTGSPTFAWDTFVTAHCHRPKAAPQAAEKYGKISATGTYSYIYIYTVCSFYI